MFNRLMSYNEVDTKPNASLNRELIRRLLPKYKRHDDMVVIEEEAWNRFKELIPLPVKKVSDTNKPSSLIYVEEDELAYVVCKAIDKKCKRLAVDKGFKDDDYRTPNMEILLGDDGIVRRVENHLQFEFDLTKCVYSFGNLNEIMRMGQLDCSDEVVVDLFAGIGHYTLPILAQASAALVYACEWNEEAVKALAQNLKLNQVDPCRCIIVEGDNRINRPINVAHRVILGTLPSSYEWLATAYECIDKERGAILHCHDLVECEPQQVQPTPSIPVHGSPSSAKSFKSSSPRNPKLTHNDDSKEFKSDESSQSNSNSNLNSGSNRSRNNSINMDNVSTNSNHSINSVSNIINKSLDDDKQSIDSPPVLLEYPSDDNISNQSDSTNFLTSSYPPLGVRGDDAKACEPDIPVSDHEREIYNLRGQKFVSKIQEEIDKDNLELRAKLLDIHVIKLYSPQQYHVVFDVSVRKPSASPISSKSGNLSSSNPNDTSYESCEGHHEN